MPYNTTAIPPRKEVTGQTQLPLSKVKKIISQDQDIAHCTNNAAFVITLATEMFVQYLAAEGQNMAKLERKPRRNIQYKDLANAVMHHDNLEFLEDVIPKTTPYKAIKVQAAATRAKLTGQKTAAAAPTTGPSKETDERDAALPNGKKARTSGANGSGTFARERLLSSSDGDPSAQLELEMRQAQRSTGQQEEDVDMDG
ncbi:hypothetical protein QBC46DRAFT_389403 [Diplogelasinospora grovesii]|uniref:Transcription factor CBF/NF-Y/archaeal histone domain-containing protein n=1 Tax=Diplogelasinospora grovesii TaxID=303347 RepID=A0AAN6N426_9PEZI|nr:hypothetical protein QBC46DRAFT_389403 [Diplogelasinospora grovesii]